MLSRLFACSIVVATLCTSPGCTTVELPPEAKSVAVVPIFRYADLGTFGHVALGQSFKQRDRLGVRTEDGGYRLRGRYMDTDGITVYVDEQNVVTQIRFDYDPASETLAALAEAYTDALGPSTGGSRGGHTQRIEWQDPVTRFELVFRRGDAPELYSILADRAAVGPSAPESLSQ